MSEAYIFFEVETLAEGGYDPLGLSGVLQEGNELVGLETEPVKQTHSQVDVRHCNER